MPLRVDWEWRYDEDQQESAECRLCGSESTCYPVTACCSDQYPTNPELRDFEWWVCGQCGKHLITRSAACVIDAGSVSSRTLENISRQLAESESELIVWAPDVRPPLND